MTDKQKKRMETGLFWLDDEPPKIDVWSIVRDAMMVIAVLLCVLALYSWFQVRDLEHELEDQKKVTLKYSGMLADVMNGKALMDHTTGTAYFFDRPVTVHMGKGV